MPSTELWRYRLRCTRCGRTAIEIHEVDELKRMQVRHVGFGGGPECPDCPSGTPIEVSKAPTWSGGAGGFSGKPPLASDIH